MAPTPYCKVCHDAGKEESVYNSHFIRETRDPNSKIVCPTLLSLECRYCSKPGHTVKYCKQLKKNAATKQNNTESDTKVAKTEIIKKDIKPVNMFSLLDTDDELEDDDLPPLVPCDDDLPPLVPCDYDLPPLVPCDYDLPPLVPCDYDLPPLVSMGQALIAPTLPIAAVRRRGLAHPLVPLFDFEVPPLVSSEQVRMPIAPTLPIEIAPASASINKHPVMSYKKIIEITHEQVIQEEKAKEIKKKEDEDFSREIKRKMEENKKKVEAFRNAPKHVFRPLNWADDDSSDEE